jgi:hypothetical protein
MIERREHPLSTADLAAGATARSPQLREPMDADLQRDDPDRSSGPESRDPAETATTRPMTAPRLATPDATETSEAPATANQDNIPQANGDAGPLFPAGETSGFRARWSEVQTGFVDEPRHAVELADGMVAEMMQRLAKVFADERSTLEQQWSQGENVSTEDLRVALRRYRSFFDRLLAV